MKPFHRTLPVLAALLAALAFTFGCGGGNSNGPDAASDGGHKDVTTKDATGDARKDARKDAAKDAAKDARKDVVIPDVGVDATSDAGMPLLVALSVTGAKTNLTPAFSSETFDYYVRCAAGTNALQVSMTASTGALSQLTLPASAESTWASSHQNLPVSANDGDAIVATARNGNGSTQYWVRCLPSDFPPFKWTTYPDAGTPTPGYYMIGTAEPFSPGEGYYAIVLDRNGVPIWYQETGYPVSDVDTVIDGAIAYTGRAFGVFYPWVFDRLEPWQQSDFAPTQPKEHIDEHDLRLLPNGNFLMLVRVLEGGVNLTGLDAGGFPTGPNSTVEDCRVAEVDPTGKVVWTWSALDHFDPAKDSLHAQSTNWPSKEPLPDGGAVAVFWCTSVDVDPANGNVLVASRLMDSVFYIDRSNDAGRVLWKMGGADASLDNARYIAMADPFHQEHDARLIHWSPTCNGGSGQISVLDDETDTANPERAVIYSVVVGGDGGCPEGGAIDGGAPGQATVAWQYKGGGPSQAAGSFRLSPPGSLDGGSRVIGWGIGWGIKAPVMTEVDEHGNKLLEFALTSGVDISFRALKVPVTAFDAGVLRATAGKPMIDAGGGW